MNLFLLRWNPTISSWKTDDFEESLARCRAGEPFIMDWSVREWEKIERGDWLLLCRVGTETDGVVAIGRFTGQVEEDDSWRGDGTKCHYAVFDTAILNNPAKTGIFRAEDLEHTAQNLNWHGGHSGVVVSETDVEAVALALADTLARIADPRMDGFATACDEGETCTWRTACSLLSDLCPVLKSAVFAEREVVNAMDLPRIVDEGCELSFDARNLDSHASLADILVPVSWQGVYRLDHFDAAMRSAQFAADLFKALCGRDGNVLLSPHSIAVALATLGLGACGETLEAILHLLHTKTADRLRVSVGVDDAVLRALRETGIDYESDTSGWNQKGLRLLREYRREAEELFAAHAQEITMNEKGRKTINAHVSKTTHDLIPELLSNPLLPDTKLILTNALWFKAKWEFPFNPDRTVPAVFHAPEGDVRVPFLRQTGAFRRLRWKIMDSVLLPYEGDSLDFIILLPRNGATLADIESNTQLWDVLLENWQDFAHTEPERLSLSVPKLSIEFDGSLVSALHSLGGGILFRETADFSGIAGTDEPLMVSEIVHKTRLDLDEDGTEAAAATAIECPAGGLPQHSSRPKPFRVDRPFLFLVRRRNTGAILFIGRVINPVI